MIPPPPTSTLFPYTTLFRSPRSKVPIDCGRRRAGATDGCRLSDGRAGTIGCGNRGEDRKSTRLNSSHEWISYAVFCLKKKKQKKTQESEERTKTRLNQSTWY